MDILIELNKRYKKQQEFLGIKKPINLIKPVVSVCIATYQHKKYIKDCIEGVLMQKTDFDFEIIIGEDGSNDGTREICIDYAQKYPDKIRLFLRDRNMSQLYDKLGNFKCRFNGRWNALSSRGKYLAICEGDDYWIDPLKLQKQVDFLDSNTDYALVYSDVNIIDANNNYIETTETYQNIRTNYRSGYIFWNLVDSNFINTLTVCVKRHLYVDFILKRPYEEFSYDLRYWLFISLRGKVKYFDQKLANYRIHSAGVSRNFDFFKKRKPLVIQSALLDYFNLEEKNESVDKNILMRQIFKLILNQNLSFKEKLPIYQFLVLSPKYLVYLTIIAFKKMLF